MKTWRFDTPSQTLVLASEGGVPHAVYWGPSLPECDLAEITKAARSDVTGGMLDHLAPISLCPVEGDSLHAQPGLMAYRNGTLIKPKFWLTAEAEDGFTCQDDDLGLSLRLKFEVKGEVIEASSRMVSEDVLTVHHFAAPVLPGPQSGKILHFSGRWIGEFRPERSLWAPGILTREARTGRSGHEHPPLAYFCEAGATNTQGVVFGMHYGWPGGHVMQAEELPDGRRQIQWGHARGTYGSGTEFETGVLALSVSNRGLNGCATAFQRHLRDDVVIWPDENRPRPVHYNCWEAIYFDHDINVLKDIADRAAELGAERFVLDDGWFGKRDDDTSSLGDWDIDPRKWPDGLTPFIAHVQRLGMTFGLWFEPEMVNLNSDLARAHPDWILGPVDQVEGRQQRVLDLANPEVREYLFDKLDAILTTEDIDYIKWDHNRLLPAPDAAQARGLLELLSRLRGAHPNVEIESCASGGGRVDAGILRHTHRVWLSDSNDALERLRIQHDAALMLPMALTGSHVGPRVCHTSGRSIDMKMRAWVAAQRHMGFEMDPRELTDSEAEVLREITQWWKDNRDWRMTADILRLECSDPAIIAEMNLAQEGDRFVVFVGQAQSSSQILPRPVRLTGLDPSAEYTLVLRTRADAPSLSRETPALKQEELRLSGAYLMQQGVVLPWSFPETMHVLEGTRVS